VVIVQPVRFCCTFSAIEQVYRFSRNLWSLFHGRNN